MPRLIEILKEAERTTVHKDCGAKIGFYPNEIIDGGYFEDYGGGGDTYYYIVCPHCGKQVQVSKYERTGGSFMMG